MEEEEMSAQLQSVRPAFRPVDPHSRFVRPTQCGRPYATELPATRLLAHPMRFIDWSDAYAVGTPSGAPRRDPQEWADAIFRRPPLSVRILFSARELLVRAVGIEPGGGQVFTTVARTDREVLLGADQSHLGFRASVLVEHDRVVVSTLVELRNRRGRAYFALVSRLHPLVVRRMLTRAAKAMAVSA
jgi:hypothetical protein